MQESALQPAQTSLPACRLTPAASYITIELSARARAKAELPNPCWTAIAVVTPCTALHAYQWIHYITLPHGSIYKQLVCSEINAWKGERKTRNNQSADRAATEEDLYGHGLMQ